MSSSSEIDRLKSIMSDQEQYKEHSKSYKKGVQGRDIQKITLITDAVQKIIVKKHDELPFVQLNAVRLIKECFELFVQEFIDMVAEKILPIMSQIAYFQQSNQKIDRGKEYFIQQDSDRNQKLETLGNSFFRLVLECLCVWGKWFPHSQFGHTYQNLVEQNITFPPVFNYFKPEQVNSSVEEILHMREEASRIRKEQRQGQSSVQESNIQSNQIEVSGIRSGIDNQLGGNSNKAMQNEYKANENQFQETKTGGGPVQEKQNLDDNPFVQVNSSIQDIQQIKNTLLEGLSKPTEMDHNLLVYFKQEFEKFSQNAQFYLQELLDKNQEGLEDLLARLFNENEFAELFIKNCNEYLQNQKTWADLQKVFAGQIKKPAQPSGQKYGDVSSTIGDYESIRIKNNMLASDAGVINNMTIPKQSRNELQQHSNNHFNHNADGEEPEATIKRNEEFTEDNKKLNQQQNNNQNVYGGNNHQERNVYNDNYQQQVSHNQQSQQTQARRDEFANYEGGKKSLREALNKNEYEKYKFQLKSKTDFSKISSNQNLSNYSQSQKKAVLNKLGSYKDSNLNNTGLGFGDRSNLNNDNQDDISSKLQESIELLRKAEAERDNYQIKYQNLQEEIARLNEILHNYRN